MTRFMSIAEREADRREHERELEADEPRARAKFSALFGDMDEEGNLVGDDQPIVHTTRLGIELFNNRSRIVAICSCGFQSKPLKRTSIRHSDAADIAEAKRLGEEHVASREHHNPHVRVPEGLK